MVELFGTTINVYAVLFLLLVVLVLYAIRKAQNDPKSDFDWTDLFTSVDQASGKTKASVSKILQIVGGITSTFIVVKLTFQNNIHFEIFATYLAYVASIEGFSKFMIAKYGVQDRSNQSGYDYRNRPYGPAPDYTQDNPPSDYRPVPSDPDKDNTPP